MLRLWLLGTAAVLSILAVWAFAPVLVFMALLSAALGLLAWGMIRIAHAVRWWREKR